jgi:UPF0755 protein
VTGTGDRHDDEREAAPGPRTGRSARSARGTRDEAPPARNDAAVPPPRSSPRGDGGTPRTGLGSWLTGVLAVALVIGAAILAWTALQLRPVDPDDTVERTFEVEPGWQAHRVATELEEADLIRDDVVMEAWLRLRGLDRRIGEGLYDLAPALAVPDVAARLAAGGRPRTARLLLPEGIRASQVAARLAALGVAPAEEAREVIEDPGDLRPPWVPDEAGLEGYLFPDTYELRLDAGARAALARPVAAFEAYVDAGVGERVREAGLQLHAWTILASLVQAEAAGPSEMPIIAGVFLNRLDRGMPLQSDPTVAYGLGKPLPELSAVDGDLRVDHPWNTYTRGGLPQGPIGNPGREALEAVLAPERTTAEGEPWLYFLHGVDDGRPVFRPNVDLASHERDVDRYLR